MFKQGEFDSICQIYVPLETSMPSWHLDTNNKPQPTNNEEARTYLIQTLPLQKHSGKQQASMSTTETTKPPTEGPQTYPDNNAIESSITHGTFYRQTQPHPDRIEDQLRSPFEYQRILILNGTLLEQLASLYILKSLMQIIIEIETGQDSRVESSTHSTLVQRPTAHAGFRFCHYFDYMCGISGGGIAAILLGRLRYTIDEAISVMQQILTGQHPTLYCLPQAPLQRSKSPLRFIRPWWKRPENSDASVLEPPKKKPEKHWLDEETKFESPFGLCRTMVVTLHTDTRGASSTPFIFRSYEIPEAADRGFKNPSQPTHSCSLADVCHAMLALPSNRWTSRDSKIDGFFHGATSEVSNPWAEVAQEISAWHAETPNPLEYVVSLGSGSARQSPSQPWYPFARYPSAPAVEDMYKDVSAEHVHFTIPAGVRDQKGSVSVVLGQVKDLVQAHCAKVLEKSLLRHWAEKLVASRKRHAGFERWEAFAFGIYYRCCVCEDNGVNAGYMDAETWGPHMAKTHKIPPFMVEEKCQVASPY